jgi:tetratricopeptide (TPR) repeat protein
MVDEKASDETVSDDEQREAYLREAEPPVDEWFSQSVVLREVAQFERKVQRGRSAPLVVYVIACVLGVGAISLLAWNTFQLGQARRELAKQGAISGDGTPAGLQDASGLALLIHRASVERLEGSLHAQAGARLLTAVSELRDRNASMPDAQLAFDMATELLLRGKPEQAKWCFENILNLIEDLPLRRRGQALLGLANVEKTLAMDLEAAGEREKASAHWQSAAAYLGLGVDDQGSPARSVSIADRARILNFRSWIWFQLAETPGAESPTALREKSLADAQLALSLTGDRYAKAFVQMYLSLKALGRSGEAAQALDAGIAACRARLASRPGDPRLHFTSSVLHAWAGRPDDALKALQGAVRYADSDFPADFFAKTERAFNSLRKDPGFEKRFMEILGAGRFSKDAIPATINAILDEILDESLERAPAREAMGVL